MNNTPDDIKKDLTEQPKFKDAIGSKNQDHHTFELGDQSTLKKNSTFPSWKSNNSTCYNFNIKCNCVWLYCWRKVFFSF